VDPNVFQTANAGFAQAMYEEYLREPGAVAPEWRRLFESGVVGEGNGVPEAGQRGCGAAGQRGSGAVGVPEGRTT
jgi:2-oxoglutarate dehydrogenase complex dehydrogenase (E1) component-like enzyme